MEAYIISATMLGFYALGQADVYLFRCCFLAENSRTDEIVTLLRGITPVSVLDDVCERFVRYCSSVLSDPLNHAAASMPPQPVVFTYF